jgi:hypothetical protein
MESRSSSKEKTESQPPQQVDEQEITHQVSGETPQTLESYPSGEHLIQGSSPVTQGVLLLLFYTHFNIFFLFYSSFFDHFQIFNSFEI